MCWIASIVLKMCKGWRKGEEEVRETATHESRKAAEETRPGAFDKDAGGDAPWKMSFASAQVGENQGLFDAGGGVY